MTTIDDLKFKLVSPRPKNVNISAKVEGEQLKQIDEFCKANGISRNTLLVGGALDFMNRYEGE